MMDAATQVDRYLTALETGLAGLTDSSRAAILDDVRAHIADAQDSGRPVPDVLAGLGTPAEVARQYLEELVPAAPALHPAPTASDRAARMMLVASIGLGVVTAVFTAFLLPSFTTSTRSSDGTLVDGSETLVQQFGLGSALLTLIPAAIAVVPLLVPRRMREGVTITGAVVLTVFAVVSGFTIGGFFIPLALMMWGAALVPLWLHGKRSKATAIVWRLVGAVALGLPLAAVLLGRASGAIMIEPIGVLILVAAFAVAVLFAVGIRAAYALAALAGATVMLASMVWPSLFVIAGWWAGGVWLVAGLTAWVGRAGATRVGSR